MRVQGDIERDLNFGALTAADERQLLENGLASDSQARAKLSQNRATERMSWVFSAFVAGYIFFEVPGGWLGDLWGARFIIFRIVLCWSLFTALTGGVKWIGHLFSAVPSAGLLFALLVAVRFCFGLGEAGAYPNIARALARWVPFQERARGQSWIWFSSRLGGAFAPAIIGGLMWLAGGWEQAFWCLGVIGIVWAIGFFFWFRDRPEDKRGVSQAEVEAIRGTAGPGSVYDDGKPPALPWKALFSPRLLAFDLAGFCVSFCFYFYITFLPKYLKEEFQIDYSQSQFLTGLPLLLGAVACLAGGWLSDELIRRTGQKRWGRSIMPLIGWTAAGLCALVVSQLRSPVAIMVLICVAFVFQDLGVPSMWSLPADIGGRYAGTVGGCMNTAGSIGGMLSPLMAAKVSIAFGWHATFVVFGIVYLVGALSWLVIDASKPLGFTSSPRMRRDAGPF